MNTDWSLTHKTTNFTGALFRTTPVTCQTADNIECHYERLPSPALPSISEMEGRELIGGAGNPGRPSRCSVALGYYLSPLSGLKKGGRLPQPMSLLTNRKSMLHSSIIS